MKRPLAAIVLLLTASIAACDDTGRKATENDVFNVYFYYPAKHDERPGREEYLGQVTGISACQRTAGNFASSKSMSRGDDWGYICCLQTKSSSCASKYK
jgi:hypothetical protein